jgi:hypothetical protein
MQEISWFKRLAPMFFVQGFLWLTLGAFAFGPWDWPMRDPVRLYGFVVACHIVLLVGYLSAAHRAPAPQRSALDPKRLLLWAITATIVLLPLTSYARTGHWVPDIVGALLDPGRAYQEAHAYMDSATNFATYVRIVASPLLVALIPIGVFWWSRWEWPLRAAVIGVAAAVVLITISTGQRRDIAEVVFIVALVSLGSHWAGVTRWSRRAVALGAVASVVAVVAFTAYFMVSHVSRIGQQAADYGANPVTRAAPNPDNAILSSIPPAARPGALGLLHYFTTGYYGLSLAQDREVRPMYGMGHSMFLTRNWERFTKSEGFIDRSLPMQISDKDGFRYPVQWCTAYPYFANDLGFLGTIVLMFVLGRLFAVAWLDLLGGRNAHALVAFTLLATLLFYLPATNRMLQDGEGVVAFYVWIAVWHFGRVRETLPVGEGASQAA